MFPKRRVFLGLLLALALLAPHGGAICASALGWCRCGHFHGEACCCLKARAAAAGHCDTMAHSHEAKAEGASHHPAGTEATPPSGSSCQLTRGESEPKSNMPLIEAGALPALTEAVETLHVPAGSQWLWVVRRLHPETLIRSPETPPPRSTFPS